MQGSGFKMLIISCLGWAFSRNLIANMGQRDAHFRMALFKSDFSIDFHTSIAEEYSACVSASFRITRPL